MSRLLVFILSCLFSFVLQGQAFTYPVPAPDTSCLQREYVASHLATVTFSNTSNSKYAIDTLPDYFANTLLVAKAYEQLQPNYNVPYKFLPEGGGDEVQATITIKDQKINPDEVVFRSPKGTQYDYTREGNTYKLQLTAGPVNDVWEIRAATLP